MKATQAPEQHKHSDKEPLTTYLAVSAVVHGVAIAGMIGSVLWWGKPTYYKPPSYSVSLVDAPLSLRQSTPADGGGEKAAEKRPELAPSPPAAPRPEPIAVEPEVVEAPPKPAPPRPEPEPKKAEPPAPKPKTVAEPPKKPPEAPPVPPPKAVPAPKAVAEPPKKPPEKHPEPKEVKQPPARTPSPPASATATEVQQAIAKLREQQARDEKTQAQARQTQQRIAEQRLAALRERFSTGAGGAAGAGAGGGPGGGSDMQRIRLQLYQERIRLQIIDAWILPMPHEEARKLQATALLTVSREGEVAHLKLLQPSGNALFDESLLRAIKHAAPLPPLPEDYQGAFLEVEMRFRPHES
jgi:TonB family protein